MQIAAKPNKNNIKKIWYFLAKLEKQKTKSQKMNKKNPITAFILLGHVI